MRVLFRTIVCRDRTRSSWPILLFVHRICREPLRAFRSDARESQHRWTFLRL